MNPIKQILFVMAISLTCAPAFAQKDLNISAIFDQFGKREGSILIELGKDVLGDHTRIRQYKSLLIPSDTALVRAAEAAIEADRAGGRVLFESRKNGVLESASYCLKKDRESTQYEYILYANRSRKMTLIYLSGTFPPSELEAELAQLKDLFIQIKNK
jgi:hypothetical protein